MTSMHCVCIDPKKVILDGVQLATLSQGEDMLKELYRQHVSDYPKFFKMDGLCKLGFMASELLLEAEGAERFTPREDRAVVLVGSHASQCSDEAFTATISREWFPSPAVFVYTLPNIVTGEIAMRNHYYGETAYYVLPTKNWEGVEQLIRTVMTDNSIRSVMGGWIDYKGKDNFEANIQLWKN